MAGIAKNLGVALGYDIGELVLCPCSFATNNTSDPVASSIRGDILSSVVRNTAGKYTLTLVDMGYEIVAAIPTVSTVGDSTDLYAQVGVTTRSAKTVVVKLKTAGTNTDLAADADNRVSLILFLRRTSASRKRT